MTTPTNSPGTPGAPNDISGAPPLTITAYSAWGFEIQIVPAYKRRDWMDTAAAGFPYACLPMSIANMGGWFVLAPHACRAQWNGGASPADLVVTIPDPPKPPPGVVAGRTWSKAPPGIQAQSAVGHGIITWTLGYIFRTPPGWNILCRGPANMVKDGIAPLEGLVETDWAQGSFSMNWKFTRPGVVTFEKDEPIAMLVPQRRGELEQFACRKAELSSNPQLADGYRKWIESRTNFLAAQRAGDPDALRRKYEKHYMHGVTTTGEQGPADHQKMRELARFEEPPAKEGA